MASEKRLIDANALCEAVDKSDRENFHKGVANRSIHHYEHIHFMKMVLDAPTVDAVEVEHGLWCWITKDIYGCNNCGHTNHVKTVMGKPAWFYCPNCGARMESDDWNG